MFKIVLYDNYLKFTKKIYESIADIKLKLSFVKLMCCLLC